MATDLLDLIQAKKKGEALSDEALHYLAYAACDPNSPDYQLAALLMAIRLKGMDERETASLALAMAKSGHVLEARVGGLPLDKHSTGGVGDTTTLVLVPLVAACGGKVVKMSGRGLGHTGGTVDKLESISGMRTELPEEEFLAIARAVGCCVVGQSANLAPADKRLYALRDVTGTVDSIPLIATSIMSKKIASGAGALVLDVKTGQGAMMESLEDSCALAAEMVKIGENNGIQTTAFVTCMDEPLGSHVGNALEVKEAIEVLRGESGGPLLALSYELGAEMLVKGAVYQDHGSALNALKQALLSGAGLEKFRQMIRAQGGDPAVCDDLSLLPQAPIQIPVLAPEAGFISAMDTCLIGTTARDLGAGRKRKTDRIDPSVGLVLRCRVGMRVKKGDELAIIHANEPLKAEQARESLLQALSFSAEPPNPLPMIRAKIQRIENKTHTSFDPVFARQEN